ncbi:DNA-binding NarL/FixJ family response regulator [Tenacibaculum adriaticum]|uniref:DNA-binding NarL/FixJ family response regulator n=1 Tax=Tenacibaculum adriaticum TaxID=413713 RepID=A0A5S5DUM1_9FLAO|nr:response regulator transcription factor [Tenacibaculum adriaticum]TYP99018.1 DNA-binding NarL/FixJ family response regulator [Tenacibaculum adriaticum]
MFTKVLISDDLGSINQGVLSVLDNLGINNVQQVQYCDDAYLKIKRAILDEAPYDLLITDLSFKADHREQKYPSGEDLIRALKQEHPELKIIAYSVEDRLQKVRLLMNTYHTDAYVCKGRHGLVELEKAIQLVYDNKNYLSPQVAQAISHKTDLEINDYDIELVKLLSNGLSQEDISIHLKDNNISPSSLSSVEKRLNKLRIQFKANNAIHLVAIVKDLGLI